MCYQHISAMCVCVCVHVCVLQATAKTSFYIMRNGDTLVFQGAAGQTCAHQVFAPVNKLCIRIRTFFIN